VASDFRCDAGRCGTLADHAPGVRVVARDG
jgi:hypothetical protein